MKNSNVTLSDIRKMKIDELKTLCKEHNLSTTFKDQELKKVFLLEVVLDHFRQNVVKKEIEVDEKMKEILDMKEVSKSEKMRLLYLYNNLITISQISKLTNSHYSQTHTVINKLIFKMQIEEMKNEKSEVKKAVKKVVKK